MEQPLALPHAQAAVERLSAVPLPARTKPADAFLDTLAEPFNEKSPEQFQRQFFEQFDEHSAGSWRCGGDLKRRANVDNQSTPSNFSRLFNPSVPRYGASTMPEDRLITIKDLYPNLSDEEARIAEANLRRYVQVIWRVHERQKSEGRPWPGSDAGFPREIRQFLGLT